MALMTEWFRWQRWRYRWELWCLWWRRDTAAVVELDPAMTLDDLRREAKRRLDAATEIELRHTGPGAPPLAGADLAEMKRLLTEADLLHERFSEAEYLQALTEKTQQMLDYYSRPPDGEASPPEAGLPPRPGHWESEPDAQGVFHRGYDAGYREGWREALVRVAGQLQALAAERPPRDERQSRGLAGAYNEAAAEEEEDEVGWPN